MNGTQDKDEIWEVISMRISDRVEGAGYTPYDQIAMRNKYTIAVNRLQELRDVAWSYAIKYRFDPVLSNAHEHYLELLKEVLKECEI